MFIIIISIYTSSFSKYIIDQLPYTYACSVAWIPIFPRLSLFPHFYFSCCRVFYSTCAHACIFLVPRRTYSTQNAKSNTLKMPLKPRKKKPTTARFFDTIYWNHHSLKQQNTCRVRCKRTSTFFWKLSPPRVRYSIIRVDKLSDSGCCFYYRL